MLKKMLVWTYPYNNDYISYLVEPEVIEERAFVPYESDIEYKIVSNNDEKLPTIKELKKLIEKYGYNTNELSELDIYEFENTIKNIGLDVKVDYLEEYPPFDNNILIYNLEENDFYLLNDEYFTKAKVIELWNGSKYDTFAVGDGSFGEYETNIIISDDYVTLDEWNGNDFNTGGVGKHQYVTPILDKDGESVFEYLVIYDSQWQGEHTTVDIMNREELKNHLESLGRNVEEYLEKIDEIRDHEMVSFLRQDNNFAEEMDELGLSPKNTLPVFVYNMDNDRYGFENRFGNWEYKNKDNGILLKNISVHEVFHEFRGEKILLINKNELKESIKRCKQKNRNNILER